MSNTVETTIHFQYNIVSAYSSLQQKLMQTKNHGRFDAGPFNQKPSIKTTPAQCPAAATGFIKLILRPMCYARTTHQTSDAEPTLAQRWFTVYDAGPTPHQIDLTCRVRRATHMKISRADPPAKLRPRPKAASLLGHRLGRRPNNKTTSIRCPRPPGNAGISKQKPSAKVGPKAGPRR